MDEITEREIVEAAAEKGGIRAEYRFAYDCHIVIVEQLREGNNKQLSWAVVTNLFCKSEAHGRAIAAALRAARKVRG
jgi:hypothetical protein